MLTLALDFLTVGHFVRLDKRLQMLDTRVQKYETYFKGVINEVEHLGAKLVHFEQSLEHLDAKLVRFEQSLEGLDHKLHDIESEMLTRFQCKHGWENADIIHSVPYFSNMEQEQPVDEEPKKGLFW